MSGIEIKKLADLQENLRRERRGVLEEVKCPQPRYRAKRHFKTAGPIDAQLRRILVHPGIDVGRKRLRITFIAGKPICLTESDEILMPVEFPGDLLVAEKLRVQIIQTTPVDQWSALPCDRLEMPIHRSSKI